MESTMRGEGGAGRADFPVLVVDDVPQVRRVVEGYLASGGFPADVAESPVDLLYKLQEKSYAAVLLDIDLGRESSCEDVHAVCRRLFPQVAFAHRKVLAALGLSEESPASGRYLLPMVKAISPQTEVLMLSGNWREEEDGPLLRDLGAYVIVPKDAPDTALLGHEEGQPRRSGIDGLQDLQRELYDFLDRIREEKAEAASESR